jgi:hypothetical protein
MLFGYLPFKPLRSILTETDKVILLENNRSDSWLDDRIELPVIDFSSEKGCYRRLPAVVKLIVNDG